MNTRSVSVSSFVAVALLATPALAIPGSVTVSDTDRDAIITLTAFDQAITNDARSRCTVRIQAGSNEIAFTAGDRVIVRVQEDDGIFDDLIFQTDFVISQAELNAGRVDRTFDCSSNFGTDGLGQTEIYAEAEIDKDECGFFCNTEDPQTGNIDVEEVEDDEAEEDDNPGDANNLGIGLTEDRIGRDQDWLFVNIEPNPSDLRFTILHLPDFGRLEVALFNEADQRLADGVDTPENTVLTAENLPVGTYRLRISPQQSNDFNFYDVRLLVEASTTECTPGDEDEQPCGNCGTQVRVCNNQGEFGDFGECSAEGECAPGDERSTACGNCGAQIEVCDDACGWSPSGECVGQGECARGEVESMDCQGGTQVRVCDDVCAWGDFGECLGNECQDNDMRNCYEGPEGSEGVGVCQGGRQFCENGRFGDCQGQITPGPEQCTDARDNDCDGDVDVADDDCALEGAEIGSACEDDPECVGDLTCLQAPENPQFEGGYCGTDDCDTAADCGADGVCGTIFGQKFCLRLCERGSDCRRGYHCANVGAVGNACVPGCANDDDCTDATRPVCDPDTNLCVADMVDPDPDPMPTPTPDMQPDPMPNPAPDMQPDPMPDLMTDNPPAAPADDGGCCTIPPARPTRVPWILLFAALAVFGSRASGSSSRRA